MKSNAGFSLVEIVIALVILTGVGSMTMSSFVSTAETTKPDASVGYNFGRGIMEKMYEFVRQDQWATNNLPLSVVGAGTGGPFIPQGSTKALNGNIYTATYDVTSVDSNANGQEDFRRVRMAITW